MTDQTPKPKDRGFDLNVKVRVGDFLKYGLGVVLIALCVWWLLGSEEYMKLIKQISFGDFVISMVFAAAIFALSGVQLQYLIEKIHKLRISWFDVFFLPPTMSLWGLIIPFQGATIYSLFLLKSKYSISLAGGLAISLFSYLITIVLTGLIGIVVGFVHGLHPLFWLVSLILAMAPLFCWLAEIIPGRFSFEKLPFIAKPLRFLVSVISPVNGLWKNRNIALVTVLLNVAHTILTVAWFYFIVESMGLKLGLTQVVLLTLINKLSIIIRLTPGNLGVDQVISGLAVSILGSDPEVGVLISLWATAATVVVSVAVGGFATISNIRYFSIKSLLSRVHT